MRKIVKAVSFTFFILPLRLGWLYIASITLIHPQTLQLQLTHFTPWLKEDTFLRV